MLDELDDIPKAHWKYNRDKFIGLQCSNCGHFFYFDGLSIEQHLKTMKYCSECGRKMNTYKGDK